jgi:predicted nuclease of predicted toxin-antitoxin system
MKLLFDENLSFKLCRQLDDLFPDSSQVRLVGLERADDRAIWNYAKANGFAVVTLDADFWRNGRATRAAAQGDLVAVRQSGDRENRIAFARSC